MIDELLIKTSDLNLVGTTTILAPDYKDIFSQNETLQKIKFNELLNEKKRFSNKIVYDAVKNSYYHGLLTVDDCKTSDLDLTKSRSYSIAMSAEFAKTIHEQNMNLFMNTALRAADMSVQHYYEGVLSAYFNGLMHGIRIRYGGNSIAHMAKGAIFMQDTQFRTYIDTVNALDPLQIIGLTSIVEQGIN